MSAYITSLFRGKPEPEPPTGPRLTRGKALGWEDDEEALTPRFRQEEDKTLGPSWRDTDKPPEFAPELKRNYVPPRPEGRRAHLLSTSDQHPALPGTFQDDLRNCSTYALYPFFYVYHFFADKVQRSFGNTNAKYQTTCCACVPTRVAMWIIAALTIGYGVYCVFSLAFADERLMSGGYFTPLATANAWLGVFGIVFGIFGWWGALDGNPDMVGLFVKYQTARIAVMLVVFLLDAYMLLFWCKGYFGFVQRIIAASVADPEIPIPRNRSLLEVSKRGLCYEAGLSYFMGFAIDFLIAWQILSFCKNFAQTIGFPSSHLIHFGHSEQARTDRKSVV